VKGVTASECIEIAKDLSSIVIGGVNSWIVVYTTTYTINSRDLQP
jgi:hypothetical protein